MKTVYRLLLSFSLSFLFCPPAHSQTASFENLSNLQAVEKRTVLVFIHTAWCRYCTAMSHSLRNNKDISNLINRKFYLVMLDGEEKNTIRFAGQNFHFKPTGQGTGIHELAEQLGSIEGKVSFPSICFLNEKNQIIYQYTGFLDSASLLKLLNLIPGR